MSPFDSRCLDISRNLVGSLEVMRYINEIMDYYTFNKKILETPCGNLINIFLILFTF